MLMQRAMSASGRLDGLSRALDLCLGVERDADAQAEISCLPSDPRRVAHHLCVKRHAVAAGLTNALEVLLGLRDHEMAVEHSASLVHEPRDRAQHDGPDRDLGDEVAVADIEVEDARTCFEQDIELLTEAGEVRGVDRRLDGARTCPLSPSHPLTVLTWATTTKSALRPRLRPSSSRRGWQSVSAPAPR